MLPKRELDYFLKITVDQYRENVYIPTSNPQDTKLRMTSDKFSSFPEANEHLTQAFEERLAVELKSFLESKHLYQSVKIQIDDLIEDIKKRTEPTSWQTWFPKLHSQFSQLIVHNWIAKNNANRRPVMEPPPSPRISFITPDPKLFCKVCNRIEAFNSVSAEDFLGRDPLRGRFVSNSGETVQLFVFSFLCQSCKSIPEVFMVRRQGLKLTISGRSPIEHIEVPAAIPKTIKRFFSDAIVAYQSGQILAGVFLLRTLVEQWARSTVVNPPDKADQVIDAYIESLPDDFKSRFPSLRSLYAELSVDIHTALGSTELFEKAAELIIEHFDARRVFKLDK